MRSLHVLRLLVFLIASFLFVQHTAFGQEGTEAVSDAITQSSLSIEPVVLLVIGIVCVLGLIIGLKMNAFLALIISAIIVSLGVGLMKNEDAGVRMGAVVSQFGKAAGEIGIVIAMAAIVGKCMLDSGAADRIVRSAVNVTGEKKASLGLMASGFILAIPVFFDTVFYLLVPLARSLYRRTGQHYLRYLMAIATGGCITHTLVPPTPGPLLVSAILGVDIGMMMMVGTMVAIPAAIAGLLFSIVVDKKMPIKMRPLGANDEKHAALEEKQLPSLGVALLPVLIPVLLIGAGTLATTLADHEDRARLTQADIKDFVVVSTEMEKENSPLSRLLASDSLQDDERVELKLSLVDKSKHDRAVELLNEALLGSNIHDETAFLGVRLSKLSKDSLSKDQLRMKPVDRRRMNRALIEDALPSVFMRHDWNSSTRSLANRLSLWSNPNFALLLAAVCAMVTLKITRSLSWRSLSGDVEESLMSGGIIILITAAGGAFGGMLQDTDISTVIRQFFTGSGAQGVWILLLGWGIAAVLKIAQGSTTVAMIVGAGMMSAIIGDAKPEFHMVYVATAVGTGSLLGSWMNDSGFWVFTKMGGLTEGESLRSWTPLLVVLAITGLVASIVLSQILPMNGA